MSFTQILAITRRDKMTLEYEQTAQDYIDFNYYYNWTDPAKKWVRLRYRLACLFFFLILVLPRAFRRGGFSKADIGLILFGVLIALITTPLVKWSNRNRVNKIIRTGKNTDLTGPRKIEFEADKIRMTSAHCESVVKWETFEKLEETAVHLFLFVTVNQAIIIPKRIFESEVALAQVKEFIKGKLQLLTPR